MASLHSPSLVLLAVLSKFLHSTIQDTVTHHSHNNIANHFHLGRRSTPNRVLTAHTEWLPAVRLRHSVPPVQYIYRIVRAGGCPAVVAQWQSTGGSSQRCPGFDSRWLPAFFTFLYFCLITSSFLYFQLEARYSQHLEFHLG